MLKTETEETVKSKSKLTVADLDFKKQSGLLPVIAQDEHTGAVLMLAYANLEAVKKLKRVDLPITGHVRVKLSGKKEKTPDICKKLWRC